MKPTAELLLPDDVQAAACRRDGEWGWAPDYIPRVIEAARERQLLNVGGQLQFVPPGGPTCECYWVSVDPLDNEPSDLGWEDRVSFAAEAHCGASKMCVAALISLQKFEGDSKK